MEYEIANRADIEELYALQLRAFESEAKMIGSRSVPALMETYAHSLADFDNWTVLVKRDEGGNIIGAIRYRKIDDHVEIGRLMVAQEHRRQGVATDLLRDVEERTQERVFELYTCTKSWINIRLYEKLGYRTFREETGENGLSFAYMRKTASRMGDEHEKKTCMEGEMAMELRDKNGLTEREFLATYDADKYPKPSLTADVAVFARDGETLRLLLIRRGGHPYLGRLALPGGFANKNEPIEQTAARELEEETGITGVPLALFGVFSKPGRDPRGWIVTVAFAAVVEAGTVTARAADDAADAQWYDVAVDGETITLTHGAETVTLRDGVEIGERHMAFDHSEEVTAAVKSVLGR